MTVTPTPPLGREQEIQRTHGRWATPRKSAVRPRLRSTCAAASHKMKVRPAGRAPQDERTPVPHWGLTEDQRKTAPWGLPAGVLAPGKVVTDPVHGDIRLNWLEVAITDSRSFQRLRRVRQLGTTHLVYPGATHTRFSHSLGAVHVAQLLLDQVLSQREGLHAVPDLIGQWGEPSSVPFKENVARAVVLARLGGLMHDLCHVPVGHSVEDDLRILEAHDENELRFAKLFGNVRSSVLESIGEKWPGEIGTERAKAVDATLFTEGGELYTQLRPLILSKKLVGEKHVAAMEPEEMDYPFVADLVGNTICADLLDYLVRDHLFAGLPASIGHRFISAFFVVPEGRGPLSKRMALNIQRHEHERSDIVSELLKALRYRYELSERALYHHAKLGADAMLGEALERWEGALWLERAADAIEDIEGHEVLLARGDTYALKAELAEADAEGAKTLRRAIREELEEPFLAHGDDGLLERMSSLGTQPTTPGPIGLAAARLRGHSAALAQALLDRKLFRIAGRVGDKDTSAEALHRAFGAAAARDGLERDAERFAELGSDDEDSMQPRVVLWLPKPGMRLKLAQVLVQHNAGIGPFVEYEESRSRRGSDIYAAHQRLWSCFVFVRRDVSKDEEAVITTYLARQMGVRWERHQKFGPNPEQWVARLAISRSLPGRRPHDDAETDKLVEVAPAVAARGAGTFSAYCQAVIEASKL